MLHFKTSMFLTCSPVEFFHDGIRGDKFDGLPCWGTIHPEVCTAFPVLRMLEESFEAWVVEQLSAAPHPSKINMPKIAALRNLKMNFEFKHPTNDWEGFSKSQCMPRKRAAYSMRVILVQRKTHVHVPRQTMCQSIKHPFPGPMARLTVKFPCTTLGRVLRATRLHDHFPLLWMSEYGKVCPYEIFCS